MPGLGIHYIHYIVAEHAAIKLISSGNADKARIINDNLNYYLLGSIGPDLFYLDNVAVNILDTLTLGIQPLRDLQDFVEKTINGKTPGNERAEEVALRELLVRGSGLLEKSQVLLVNGIASLGSPPFPIFQYGGNSLESDEEYTEKDWSWADLLHYRLTGKFAKNLLERAQSLHNERFEAFA